MVKLPCRTANLAFASLNWRASVKSRSVLSNSVSSAIHPVLTADATNYAVRSNAPGNVSATVHCSVD